MVTTFDQQPPSSAPPKPGGSGGTGERTGQLAADIEHKVNKLANDAKNEGVPIVGHTLEGLDNVGDSGGQPADPFAQLFASGFGWLIDSVGFLRDPIEKLDGDAAAVQTAVEAMKTVTSNLTYVAHGHREDLPNLADWEGETAAAYRASMSLLHEELLCLSYVVDGLGTLTAVSGAMVITLRKVVRDLVATAIGSVVVIMIAAMAAAVPTLGTSIAVGVAAATAAALTVFVECMRRITMLLSALGRQTERMGELETVAENIATQLDRFEQAAGIATSGGEDVSKRTDKLDTPQQNDEPDVPRQKDESDRTNTSDGPAPEGRKGGLGKVELPPPGPRDADPEYWNDLWEKADKKVKEFEEEAISRFFDHGKYKEAMARREEWAHVRDEADAKWREATEKLEDQELDAAKKELGT